MPKYYYCPFFKFEEKRGKAYLHCEAGQVRFPSDEGRKRYIERYCADINGYGHCTLARMMEDFYGGR